MSGHESNGPHETRNVLDLDDELRKLASPDQPWDREKAAYIVGRLTYLGSIADPGSRYAGIAEMSVYHWRIVYMECRVELREIHVAPRPRRWFLSRARRQEQAQALTVRDRLNQRAYRAWIIRDLFREALRLAENPQNAICYRFPLTSHPTKGGQR